MQETILVVDDEAKIREFIIFFLVKEGHKVVEANNGQSALEILQKQKVDLIILDIMMPLIDGFSVCETVRNKLDVPIIMLTAVEGEREHIKGYALGADDYVIKPFKMNILIAKIKRLLEKSNIQRFVYGEFALYTEKREVCVGEEKIKLAPKEYELLDYLVTNKNIALSRDKLIEKVWGHDFEGGNRVVDNHIKKIRAKLKDYGSTIKTVVSFGYKFEV